MRFISLPGQITLLVVLLLALAAFAIAAPPQTINYQGYLRNTAGTPVSSETTIRFSLYSSNPARNNPVWRETKSITPSNGIFSTQLGSTTPVTAPFDVPYWLGVKVAGDDEMALQALSSTGYALRAGVADAYGEGSIDSSMISDGAVSLDKLADTCAAGQVLRKGASGWECGPNPY
jgi:hypothetical protein